MNGPKDNIFIYLQPALLNRVNSLPRNGPMNNILPTNLFTRLTN